MDPITTVIVAASSQLATSMVKDLYDQLKATIIGKFGENNSVQKAIEEYESKPESEGRIKVLEEEVKSLKIDKDREILALAEQLLEILERKSGDHTQVNVQINDGNVQGIIGTSNLQVRDFKIDNTKNSDK
jgi:hypothetical protein